MSNPQIHPPTHPYPHYHQELLIIIVSHKELKYLKMLLKVVDEQFGICITTVPVS